MSAQAAAGCPRTGRTRAPALAPGATRPSDTLTAFLSVGVAWLVAAAVAGGLAAVTGHPDPRWLALHFAFVGGVSQLVIGAAQFFACAFLATEPPSRGTVRLELALWNCGVVAIAAGVPLGITALTGVGGTLLLVGLAVFAQALRRMRRRSLQRAPWATRWYLTSALFLACGAALGPVMAGRVGWAHGSLLGAHLALNLGGWFGTAIVGTLHTFYPSLTGTLLRRPRLQAPTYAAWCAGVGALAVSAAFDLDAGGILAWSLLLGATLMLGTNLVASAAAAQLRSPGLIVVSAGQAMLVLAVVLGLAAAVGHGPLDPLIGPARGGVAAALVGGWIGLTVVGALLHLLALMERVRLMPERRERSSAELMVLVAAGAVSAGLLGLALTGTASSAGMPGDLARLVVALGYGCLLGRVVVLAARAVRASPLRI